MDNDTRPALTVGIVGAGISGLACARQILESNPSRSGQIRVVLLEASDRVGGRIRGDKEFLRGLVVDLGAEFVHGSGTVLTEWIDDFRQRSKKELKSACVKLEEFFTLSHADGGGRPDRVPTSDGNYGMFFVDGELVMFDDERIEKLNEALEEVLGMSSPSSCTSLLGGLRERRPLLPAALMGLAVASYGHTAGCCNLDELSLSMLQHFEEYWEEHEEEGDYRISPEFGMLHIVDSCCDLLELHENFELRLESAVSKIAQTATGCVVTVGDAVDSVECDHVVVTIPPTLWSSLDMDIPSHKRESVQYIGFERSIKVILYFSECLWPVKLQNIICVAQPIPEVWFRTIQLGSRVVHIATGFLMSTAAENFQNRLKKSNSDDEKRIVSDVFIEQLSKVLHVDASHMRRVHGDTLLYDWSNHPYIKGGYMYPRVGITPADLEKLAEPVGRIHFAGEATNTNACCTVQSAIETGLRAADEILKAS